MSRFAWLLVLLASSICWVPAVAQNALRASAVEQIAQLQNEKRNRSAAQKKLNTALWYGSKRQRKDAFPFQSMPGLRTGLNLPRSADGRVHVDIRGTVTNTVLTTIVSLGGLVVSSYPQYNSIHAQMPLVGLESLGNLPDVRSIRPAYPPMLNKENTSEGDFAHRADVMRNVFNVDSTGVKICAISDSFNNKGGAAALVASGDLPGPGNPDGRIIPIDLIADLPSGGSDEGRAMLEIIFDLAPGATLGFATAGNTEAEFAANITALVAAGCDVIVDDIFFFTEAAFQDDVIAAAVDLAVASGVQYFSSAGNAGNLNDGTSGVWEGDFIPSATVPPGLNGLVVDVQDFGTDLNANQITNDPPFAVTLHWSDALGASDNDYDLIMLDPSGTNIIAVSADFQDGDDDPFESIGSSGIDDTGNLLVIARSSGTPAPRAMHLNTLRGQVSVGTDGQISGHTAANGAFAIAAVRETPTPFATTLSLEVETFSSDGPRRVFFAADGTPFTPGDFSTTGGILRETPIVTAADGVATATTGFNPFFGTSAAAPHAAAIAGLLLQLDPALDASGLRDVLAATSIDIEAPGRDRDSGYGVLDAVRAAERVAVDSSTAVVLSVGSNVLVTPIDTVTGTSPLTAEFESVDTGGVLVFTSSTTGPAAASGFSVCGGTPTYSSFETTAQISGSVEVCVDLSVASCGTRTPQLQTFVDGAWVGLATSVGAGQVCANTDSLGLLAVFDALAVEVILTPGLNLFSAPRSVPAGATSCYSLLAFLGGSGVIESISTSEQSNPLIQKCSFNGTLPAGTNFPVVDGGGYLVRVVNGTSITFDTPFACPEVSMAAGTHLIGIPSPSIDLSCYDLLEQLGPGQITAVESLDQARRFQSCAFDVGGEIFGNDFPIVAGIAYFLHTPVGLPAANFNDTGNPSLCLLP